MSLRHSMRGGLALALGALIALASLPAVGWAAGPEYVPGQILVKYKAGTTQTQRALLRSQLGGPRLNDLRIINGESIKISGMSVEKAVELARRNPNVAFAEPDWIWHIEAIPNDTRFNELYAMRNTGQTGGTAGADIQATNAWDVFTGNPNTLVGVIDTGVDYNHPDLAANAWTNPGEIPGNSIDDDLNGYVDDIHGYDFVNNDGDPFDDHGHGTHCSGTIGGVGNNNLGVTGVNWTVKIAGIKFLSAGGSGSTENAIRSVDYARAINCNLTSNSWGGGPFSQLLLDAINAAGANNMLFIAAAGNNSSNNDTSPFYPATYASPYIISVAATDHNDLRAGFSNFGAATVHLGAPGDDILSCAPGGGYVLNSGTSMACPHVSGVAALIYGRFPGIHHSVVKFRILNFAEPIPSMAGITITGGRLNALLAVADADTTEPAGVSDLATQNPGSTAMDVVWTATGDDGGVGTASRTELRYSTGPIDENNFAAATLAGTPDPLPAGGSQTTTVNGLAFSTLYYFAIKAFDEFDNAGPISNVATGTTLGEPNIATSSLSQVDLQTGQQADRTLTITNTGDGRLDFSLPNPIILFKSMIQEQRSYPNLVLAKGQADPRVGDPVIAATGGPDAAGYRWIDSDEPGGPTFAWTDISGIGTAIPFTGDDQNLGPYPIGFPFPFYGNNFTTVRVCTNGWLSFTATSNQWTNQSLPNTATTTPRNLVAPFWDDLIFTTSGDAYYHNDGSRFIVQWHNAPHYTGDGSAPGPYTFQAILYPTGEIRFQYLSLAAPLTSQTIGIQDANGTIGLTTVFNAAYAHNNLAVKYMPLRQWCTVSPNSGQLFSSQSADITVHYDATGLEGGIYNANVRVESNDPQAPTDVPAILHVEGVADITCGPASTDFGLVFLGYPQNRNVVVSNDGTDVLNISNIVSSDGAVSANPTNFSLNPNQSQNVTLTYNPGAPGTLSGTVTVQSDDPDEPSVVLDVEGSANDAPDIETYQTAMGAMLPENSSETQQLHINNLNIITGATLDLTVTPSVQKALPPQIVRASLPLGKDQRDPRQGEIAANGGPDAFGYRWIDSNSPGGPVFNWTDISGVGTNAAFTGDDQSRGPFNIGFSFPFYGNNFTTVRICSNGWLSFTDTGTMYANQPLPTNGTSTPANMVAPLWDDLNFTSGGQCHYYNDGSRFIVQWTNVPHYTGDGSAPGPYTFQAILYPTGRILYQYLSINPPVNSNTIGIQNATKTIGLQVVFNANYVANNLAVLIQTTPDWLTVAPGNASLPGHGSTDLDIGFNSAGMTPGTYLGNLHIASNDPDEGSIDIPVTLKVGGATDNDVDRLPLAFGISLVGGNPARGNAQFMLALPQGEKVDLMVYNVRGEIVRQLMSETRAPGVHPVRWDGRDTSGQSAASGVYFARMRAGTFDRTVRLTLVK